MVRSLRVFWLAALVFFGYGSQLVLSKYCSAAWVERRWARLHARNSRRLAQRFADLGGVFIKMGQVLSVMAPVLPPVYAQELEKLQDAVPPRPFGVMRERLLEAWGHEPERRLQWVDESALAAASLAQVHRARLLDGTEVVLKMLYPGIERLIGRDLATVRTLIPGFRLLFGFRDSGAVLDQLTTMLEHEMDYRRESNNVERIRAILRSKQNIIIPTVVDELSTQSVLVLSYEPGLKAQDPDALRANGIDPEQVATTLVEAYVAMLFEHRVFHADPHPGNLLARDDGTLVLLDFGAVEEASESLINGIKQVVIGALSKNTAMVMEGIESMGFVAPDGDRSLLERVAADYLRVLSEVNIRDYTALNRDQLEQLSGMQQLRGKLRQVASSVRYPDGYFYVERTLALLFGVTARLAPTKGLLGIAAPYTSKLLLRSLAERKGGTATSEIRHAQA